MMSSVKTKGSKAEVWHGTALHTSGGLVKDDLMKNKGGRIVSRKKHAQGVEAFKRNGMKPKTAEELAEMRPKKRSKGPSPTSESSVSDSAP